MFWCDKFDEPVIQRLAISSVDEGRNNGIAQRSAYIHELGFIDTFWEIAYETSVGGYTELDGPSFLWFSPRRGRMSWRWESIQLDVVSFKKSHRFEHLGETGREEGCDYDFDVGQTGCVSG